MVERLDGLAAVHVSLCNGQLVETHGVTRMPVHIPLEVWERTLVLSVAGQHETAFAASHLVRGLQFEIAVIGCRRVLIELELCGNLREQQENVGAPGCQPFGLGQQRSSIHRPLPLQICLGKPMKAIGIIRALVQRDLEHTRGAFCVARMQGG